MRFVKILVVLVIVMAKQNPLHAMAHSDNAEFARIPAPRDITPEEKESRRGNFLLNWDKLINRHEFDELLLTDQLLLEINESTIKAAIEHYKMRLHAKEDEAIPQTLVIAEQIFATIYFDARKLFIDVGIPFASGSQKDFFVSIMIELDTLGEIRCAFLVARALIKDFAADTMDTIFDQSLLYGDIRRMEHHLTPVPFFTDRTRFTLYYQLFQGDLTVLIKKIRRELNIVGDDPHHQIHKQRYIDLVLEIARQLLHALTVLHENGFVHRDIKAQNVLFLGSLTIVRVYISDFDDMKSVKDAALDPSFLGTERYLSPQKRKNDLAVALTQADDCYALGMLLWDLFHIFDDDKLNPLERILQEKSEYYGKNGEGYQKEYKGHKRQFAAKAHFVDEVLNRRNAFYEAMPITSSFDSLVYSLTLTKIDRRSTAEDAKYVLAKRKKKYIEHFFRDDEMAMSARTKGKLIRGRSTSYLEEDIEPLDTVATSSTSSKDERKSRIFRRPKLISALSDSLLKRHHLTEN